MWGIEESQMLPTLIVPMFVSLQEMFLFQAIVAFVISVGSRGTYRQIVSRVFLRRVGERGPILQRFDLAGFSGKERGDG
jgi:hypothetical protein